jgi:hypothetical protein
MTTSTLGSWSQTCGSRSVPSSIATGRFLLRNRSCSAVWRRRMETRAVCRSATVTEELKKGIANVSPIVVGTSGSPDDRYLGAGRRRPAGSHLARLPSRTIRGTRLQFTRSVALSTLRTRGGGRSSRAGRNGSRGRPRVLSPARQVLRHIDDVWLAGCGSEAITRRLVGSSSEPVPVLDLDDALGQLDVPAPLE